MAPLKSEPEVISELGEGSDHGRDQGLEFEEEDVMPGFLDLNLDELEVGVSEEQIADNDRRQEDEVLALEAIYQDNLVVFNTQGGHRSFQIFVHYEVPDGITVSAKFHSGTGTSNTKLATPTEAQVASNNSNDKGFLYTFGVNYLPPMVLKVLLPKSYPSHHPPYFTITTQWLDKVRVSSLCAMLDAIWRDQPGQEVVFQWTEWLHGSALSHLGFTEEVTLWSPHDNQMLADCRAISENVVPERAIPILMGYNEKKCHEAFLSNMHQCLICFSEYLGSEFIKLPCQHIFCSNCMETYSKMHVKEGSVTKISCPSTKCGVHVPPLVLKRLLGDEDYERWESLLLQRTLDAMSDVVYCPRCETACLEDSKSNDAQCSKCFFSFCTLCRDRRHVGEKCMDAETRLRVLQERMQPGATTNEQLRKQKDLINELLSVKEALKDAKQCPSCKMLISRTEGCNKMVCSNCDQYFCYKCNKAIDGYDHFRQGCELFPREEIVRWEENINARQVVAQVRAELFAGQANHPCPHCGQRNAKEGNNNHLFCWACQTHYCALCHKVVRRSSEHFSRKGCKQHTSDP
ncbi:E3 ubiquitin-protein ligase RNF14 [Rhynchospora pubera]|uniref:RBR-type E3 ubiquitin transferase n=1 Tax=Rhynchospora pubera TaxID=906938 RepID=A0AAV8BTC1_9POAL|nr:E3 ubiquitin-protein ligase RNF14 [Rhynchospora pubera]